MNSNKILIITSEFPPQPGGIGNHAYQLALALYRSGSIVSVLCDDRSKDGKEEKDFDNLLPFLVRRISSKRLRLRTYFYRIRIAIKMERDQELILLSGKFSLWTGGLLKIFSRKKFIAVVHGSELRLPNPMARKLTEYCLKQFDSVIAVSHYTHSLINHLHLKNSHVIFNGFEEVKVTPRTSEIAGPLQVITVGNVTPRKGQQNVIKALPMLKQAFPGITYHVVGIPTYRDSLQELAKGLGVSDALVFHGRVDEEKKWQLLKQAHVFVMLSEQTTSGDVEGFGIAILEANSLGLPALGSKGCGIEDSIKDGYSGKLLNPGVDFELVENLKEICDNYAVYAKNALQWSESFSWKHIGKEYLNVLHKI